MTDTGTCKIEWQRPAANARVGKIQFIWTSSVSGTVIKTTDFVAGEVLRFTTNPGATAPTADYDITITDEDSYDILKGLGANRHTSTTQTVYPQTTGSITSAAVDVKIPFSGLLQFNVSAAGTAKVGVATLYYR